VIRRNPRHGSQAGQRGSTLTEVMVSVVLFSVGVIGLMRVLGTAVQDTGSLQYRATAATLADHGHRADVGGSRQPARLCHGRHGRAGTAQRFARGHGGRQHRDGGHQLAGARRRSGKHAPGHRHHRGQLIMKNRNQGFTLVEVMIALVIASITAVIVLNVLISFQSRKQTTAGSNDAAISASLGMYSIEREVRMAGAGYTNALGLACPQGVNIAYNDVAIVNGGQVMPLQIVDGGANPDQISIVRSNAELGVAPATVMTTMASAVANVVVDRNTGFNVNDLLLVTSNDGSVPCTIMQLSGAPTALGWQLGPAPCIHGRCTTRPRRPLYSPRRPLMDCVTPS
jgi:prepilin-type N-terminal cleavage/methylation domain-containing protein